MPEGFGSMAGDVARAPGSTAAPSGIASASDVGHTLHAAWRRALFAFAIAFAALVAAYFETVLDLWQQWGKTGTYAHGYFIFPISVWLIWRARAQLAPIAPRVQPWALVPLVACGALWLAGHSADVHVVVQYAFVAMVPCLVWGVFGNGVTRRVVYPLAFLFFAVPTGEFLMPTLMDHTADFTVTALRLSGVPVFREGNYFSIPSGSWSVVEACSGIRYLIASITLGVLFAYLNYRAAWRRVAFIAAAIVVPIIANWLRAYMIVMIAHLSSNKLATGVDHLVYGWLFFGLVMMLLFSVGNLWRDDGAQDPPPVASNAVPATPASASGPMVALTAALIAVAAPWPALGAQIEAIANAVRPGDIGVEAVPGWQRTELFTTFRPEYGQARSTETAAFASDAGRVGLFIGYYSGQLDHGPMITYANDIVLPTNKAWSAVARDVRTVASNGTSFAVDATAVRGEGTRASERLLTWRWYWINGRSTTNKYLAKAYTALDKIAGRGDDSAVIVVMTPTSEGVDGDASGRLASFVANAEPVIRARLAAVHDEGRR